jgi:hypothetical protein
MTLNQLQQAAIAAGMSLDDYALYLIQFALTGGSGSITSLVSPNSSVVYDAVKIEGDGATFLTALNEWRADNPTFITMETNVVTCDDGDFLIIKYTTNSGSGDISKLVANNSLVNYTSLQIAGEGHTFLDALNLWRSLNPTYITLETQKVTCDDGDYLIIKYTV